MSSLRIGATHGEVPMYISTTLMSGLVVSDVSRGQNRKIPVAQFCANVNPRQKHLYNSHLSASIERPESYPLQCHVFAQCEFQDGCFLRVADWKPSVSAFTFSNSMDEVFIWKETINIG